MPLQIPLDPIQCLHDVMKKLRRKCHHKFNVSRATTTTWLSPAQRTNEIQTCITNFNTLLSLYGTMAVLRFTATKHTNLAALSSERPPQHAFKFQNITSRRKNPLTGICPSWTKASLSPAADYRSSQTTRLASRLLHALSLLSPGLKINKTDHEM